MNEGTHRLAEPSPIVAEIATKLTSFRVADVDERSVWNEAVESGSYNGPAEPAELKSTAAHND